MVKRNILFVGAHPDDIEFGCGGTLRKHIEKKDSVFCLIMTNGEKGNHSPKKEECINSLNFLGVKEIFFGNFPDGYLSDNQETVNFIESLVKKLKIDRIYTHDPNDRHQDHRHCSLAVSAAARGIKEVLLFQGPSTNFFYPHYIIELSEEQVNKKVEAIGNYKSQLDKFALQVSSLKHLSAITGSKYNIPYAEAFALNHMLIGENDV